MLVEFHVWRKERNKRGRRRFGRGGRWIGGCSQGVRSEGEGGEGCRSSGAQRTGHSAGAALVWIEYRVERWERKKLTGSSVLVSSVMEGTEGKDTVRRKMVVAFVDGGVWRISGRKGGCGFGGCDVGVRRHWADCGKCIGRSRRCVVRSVINEKSTSSANGVNRENAPFANGNEYPIFESLRAIDANLDLEEKIAERVGRDDYSVEERALLATDEELDATDLKRCEHSASNGTSLDFEERTSADLDLPATSAVANKRASNAATKADEVEGRGAGKAEPEQYLEAAAKGKNVVAEPTKEDGESRVSSRKPAASKADTKTPSKLEDTKRRRKVGAAILAEMKLEREGKFSDQATQKEFGWQKRGNSRAFLRSLEIWWFFAVILITEVKVRREKEEQKRDEMRLKNAKRLKAGLLRLGVDVLPFQYIEELQELQDKVPGFNGEKAIAVIEADLGAPIEELYDAFDPNPVAAASLGQVHLAVLKGNPCAVKVQRQGLRELFDVDLKNLKVLAQLLERFDPKTDGASRDWVSIYEESAVLLYEEIDYNQEGRNADRFRRNFSKVPWVKVPKVYWERTSTRVLTMEYCPGIKISQTEELAKAGIDLPLVAERSGQSYLTQVFRHGFFHCDPHPGNISVDAKLNGRLIYYDFGMMAEIKPEVKTGLVNLIFGVYEGSEADICDALEQMGVLMPNVDRVTVEKVGRYFLNSFRTNMLSDRLGKLSKEEAKEELSSRLTAIGEDLVSVSDDQPFRFPATFSFVFRAFTTLEGVGKGLTKKYDLTRIAQPFLKELIDLKDGSAAASAAKNLRKKLGWRKQDIASVVTQPRRVEYITGIMKRIENGDLRIRARVLESERAYKRMQLVQENLGFGIVASTMLNGALVLSAAAEKFAHASRMMWLMAFVSGLRVILGIVKLRNLDKKIAKITRKT